MVHERQSGTYTASRFTTGAAMAQDPMMSDFMDYYLVHKSESHKFIRMADDLHDVASYLNEMRICFLLLTGTVYLILAIYFVSWCVRRNHRHVNSGSASANRQRGRWDLQGEEYQNAVSAQTNIGQTSDDLVSVRSDGALPGGKGGAGHGAAGGIGTGAPQFGMGGRAGAANRQAPSFMRHSGTGGGTMQNHSGGTSANATTLQLGATSTTRLMADTTGAVITKQQQNLTTPSGLHHQHMANLSAAQHHHGAAQQLQLHSPSSAGGGTEQHHQQQHTATMTPAGGKQISTSSAAATTTACLLNNFSEDAGKGIDHPMTSTGMPTFGVRSRERVMMDRNELQPLSGNGGAEL